MEQIYLYERYIDGVSFLLLTKLVLLNKGDQAG